MMTDIEIAQSVKPKNIYEIAQTAGIDEKYIEPYGRAKAKISLSVAVYNHYKRLLYKDAAGKKDSSEDVEIQKSNVLLLGPTGVGKTFLTNCIAKELLDRSYTVVYLTSLKLFDILETYKFDRDLSQTQKNASLSYILTIMSEDLAPIFEEAHQH